MNIDEIKNALPENWHDAIDELSNQTVLSDEPLKVCLVGAFSTGKSSLINKLMEQEFLPTSLEETTALPTFIEFGDKLSMQVMAQNGTSEELTLDTFRQDTVKAPAGAACTILQFPLDWLKGLILMDLPGLGSTSSINREYTIAQIRMADAILYLVPSRGPGREDIETLTLIRQYGKRFKIAIAQWDDVEKSVSSGEKAPDLEQWANEIEQGTGIKKVRLVTVSKYGHGRADVFDFFERAKTDLVMIRERRFKAELLPLIENAIGQNQNEQQTCLVQTEEAIQTLHTQLILRKQVLIELKASVYDRQNKDHVKLETTTGNILQNARQGLTKQLETLRASVQPEHSQTDWETFLRQGTEQCRTVLGEAAYNLSEISADYGNLELPQANIEALNLRLPTPELVDTADFIDISKLHQLEITLKDRQQRQEKEKQKLAMMVVPKEKMEQHENELAALRQQQRELQSMQLPKVIQQIEGSRMGRTIGRVLGEVADIALLFVNPTVIATKTASIVGKGAKFAKIAVNTTKVAKNITKGIKVASASKLGKNISPVVEKLGMLEMLSLGYWGEKIGGMFDGVPQYNEYTDPEALAEQQAALNEVNGQITAFNRQISRLQDIETERELSGYALEQSQKEQAQIALQIETLKKQAQVEEKSAREDAEKRHAELVRQQIDKAVNHWLRSFDQQTRPMIELLFSRCKTFWQEQVEQMLSERVMEIDQLTEQLRLAPQEKEANLKRLEKEADQLQSVIGLIL